MNQDYGGKFPAMTTEKRSLGNSPIDSRIAAEIAAATERYDPLAPNRNKRGMWIGMVSAALHVIALFLLSNVLFGDPLEEEETVLVSILEEEKPPEPEPEKARPKAIRRRTLNTATAQRREVIQNEVRKIEPVPVVAQVQKVEVAKVQRVQAPKLVERREITTKTVNEFAQRQVQQPTAVPSATDSLRTVAELQQSAGPRRVAAAGPVVAQAAQVSAPNLSDGLIDNMAVEGDVDGARIAPVESGNASRYTQGDGELGLQPGQNKDCNSDPVCQAYLKEIQRRVYQRWRPGRNVPAGRVRLAFRIDKSGAAYSVKLVKADDDVLGETCATAFRHASPFPPPPKSIHYLASKGIIATFSYDSGSSE